MRRVTRTLGWLVVLQLILGGSGVVPALAAATPSLASTVPPVAPRDPRVDIGVAASALRVAEGAVTGARHTIAPHVATVTHGLASARDRLWSRVSPIHVLLAPPRVASGPSFAVTLIATPPYYAGNQLTLTVTALNADGSTNTGYLGSIQIFSTDPTFTVNGNQCLFGPAGHCYTFQTSDLGQHVFAFAFDTAGSQTASVADSASSGTSAPVSVLEVYYYIVPSTYAVQGGAVMGAAVQAWTGPNGTGSLITNYTGSAFVGTSDPAWFWSSGSCNIIYFPPVTACFTFSVGAGGDNGQHIQSVTFNTGGYQTITATDQVNRTRTFTTPSPGIDVDSLSTVLLKVALAVDRASYNDSAGDPVQTATGMFTYSHTDLTIPGRGPTPLFVRSYNSLDDRTGPLGPGWTHSDNVHLNKDQDGSGAIVITQPTGREDRYARNPDASYTAPHAIYNVLVRNTTDFTYTLTHPDQSVWTFDGGGKLIRITDRYGNVATFTYNPQSQLTSVSDPAGRGSLAFTYTNGLLTSIADWASPARTVGFQYDGNGRLWKVTDRVGTVTTFGYDGTTSHLTTITDGNSPSHTVLALTYDSQGRVQTQKDAHGLITGQATAFSYGTNTTTVTYPTTSLEPGFNPSVTDTYDTQGRLTSKVTKPSSTETSTESYGYDANFDRTSYTDAKNNQTLFCYDVDYSGNAITPARGTLTRRISPPPASGQNPLVTLLQYDSKSNLIETISPKGVTNGTSVSCSTNLAGSINTLYATDFAYDAATQTLLQSVTKRFTDPDLGAQTAKTTYEYTDSVNKGLVTFITPPRGNTGANPDHSYATTFTYYTTGSQAGLLQQVQDAVGNKTTYTYDNVGRRLTMVDPNGNASGGTPADHTWSSTYDKEDRLLTASAPAPAHGGATLTTTATYDAVGNRTVVKDPNGQVTTYLYDERDLLQEVDQSPNAWTDPAVTPSPKYVTTYSYDNLSNLVKVKRAAGDSANERETDYAYDGLNRVRSETQYPSWPTTTPTLVTTTAYDANSNRATVTDPLNQTTQFAYDTLNRLTGVAYIGGGAPNVSYSYDGHGNRTSMADGTGSTSYTYDEQDRLLSVTSPGTIVVGYRYDLDGNRRKLLYPDATAVTSTFDKADRLTSLADWASRTTSYGYFPDGHLQTTTNVNGTTATMTEDNTQRLTQVWNKTSGGSTISKHTYTLDSVGNRTQVQENLALWRGGSSNPTVAYSYDKLYWLTQEQALTYTSTYQYDPVGNRTQFNQGGTPVNYTYDKADRVQTAGILSYTVNANGNLVARNNDTFTYDQANRLTSVNQGRVTAQQSVTTNTYDGDGKRVTMTESTHTTITHVYDSNRGLPVVLQDGLHKNVWGIGLAYTVSMDGQNTVQVPHTDGLGSVRALTDSTGTVVEDYQTDAFGVPVATDGPNYTQRFQYAGEQRDYDGLLYLRARFYDPVLGRFMGRDPYGGSAGAPLSLNRYSYVANNPVTGSDASGLAVSIDCACGGPTDGGSQVKDDRSEDNLQCDQPDYKPELQLISVVCTPPQVLGQVPVAVLTPLGTFPGTAVFAAIAPSAGSGGNNKVSARETLKRLGVTPAQEAAARSAIKRATTTSTIDIVKDSGGNVTVRITRPGASGYQVIESVINPDGTKTVTQLAYNAAGNLVHFDPKTP